MNTKTIPISEFKAHCTEELRAIEEGRQDQIEITRHGKVIAIACAPKPPVEQSTLLGAAAGTATLSADYDPHAPAFSEDDWNSGDSD